MSANFKTKLVVNPRSANGRTGKNWPKIEAEVRRHLPEFEFEFTAAPGDGTRIARQSLKDGFEMIVSLGGDGTNNEVINGFFENGAPVRHNAVFGVLPMGTGGDFVKTAGISKNLEESAPLLAGRSVMPCDVGLIRITRNDGSPGDHYFINIADFGLGGVSVIMVNNTTKFFRGFMSFFIGTVRAAIAYRDRPVHLTVDGQDFGTVYIRSVIAANGGWFGGGMNIAPDAQLDDGLFEVLILRRLSFVEGLKILPKLYNGGAMHCESMVTYLRAKEIIAESDEEVLFDVDGEQPGRLPAKITILPSAVMLKCPGGTLKL